MRRITIALGLVLAASFCAAQTDMAAVLHPIRECSSDANGTKTCTFNDSSAFGDVMHLFIHGETAGMATPTTNLSGTTFSLITSNTSGGAMAWEYCAVLGASGVATITLNGSTSWEGIFAVELPNTLGYGCTTDATTNGTPGADPFTSSITTTKNGDLVFCFSTSFHSGTVRYYDHGSGVLWLGTQNGGDAAGLAYFYSGTNGSQSCVAHNDMDGNARYIMSSFKVSSISVATQGLPNAIQATDYKYALMGIGGAGAYTWSVSSGTLPTGITLNSSTGVLSASNVTGTTQTVTFQVTDGTNTATKSLTLTVNSSAATPTLVSNSGIQTGSGPPHTVSLGAISSGTQILVGQFTIDRDGLTPPTDTCGTVFKYVFGQDNHLGSGGPSIAILWSGVTTTGCTDVITSYSQAVGSINVSGLQPFYDVANGNDGSCTSGVAFTGPSFTTLAVNSFGWDFGTLNNGSTSYTTSFSGFSLDASQSGSFPYGGIHGTEATTGTYAPTMTPSANTQCVITGAFLRPSGSGTPAAGIVRHKSQVF